MTDQPKIDKRKLPRDHSVRPDWASIEKDYRAGIMSVSAIARDAGIDEASIRNHAKKHNWKRDLVYRVRRKTTETVIRSLGLIEVKTVPSDSNESITQRAPLDEEAIIDLAVRTQVEVIRDHRKAAGAGRALTYRMLAELDETTGHLGELKDEIESATDDGKRRAAMNKAISLPARAATMRDLATAAAKWVQVERQAFGIVDDRGQTTPMTENVDQLRNEILAELDALGLGGTVVLPPARGLANGHANGHGNGNGHYTEEEQ